MTNSDFIYISPPPNFASCQDRSVGLSNLRGQSSVASISTEVSASTFPVWQSTSVYNDVLGNGQVLRLGSVWPCLRARRHAPWAPLFSRRSWGYLTELWGKICVPPTIQTLSAVPNTREWSRRGRNFMCTYHQCEYFDSPALPQTSHEHPSKRACSSLQTSFVYEFPSVYLGVKITPTWSAMIH